MEGVVSFADRLRILETVREQDLIDRKMYLSRLDERIGILIQKVDNGIRELQEKWKSEMLLLTDRQGDRVWLEFLSEENDNIREKSLLNLRTWVRSTRENLQVRMERDAYKNLNDWIRKFESGPRTEERLNALISERAFMRRRQIIDDLHKKDAEYMTIFNQKTEYVSGLLQIFTRVFERAIR
jgi:hypothetical protein